jgi:hypothetical protein
MLKKIKKRHPEPFPTAQPLLTKRHPEQAQRRRRSSRKA